MAPLYLLGGSVFLSILLIREFLRRIRHRSINYLPGPPPGSWLLGNMKNLVTAKIFGEDHLKWTREHGTAIRTTITFGRDMLFLVDPKGLQHILNASGYNYRKAPDYRILIELTAGRGVTWAEGAQHSRHRKVMNPAFSFSALRVFVPIFRTTARRAVDRIKEKHFNGENSAVMNIMPWLSHIALDVVGEAGFGYQFHVLDNAKDSKLAGAYQDLLSDVFVERPAISVAFLSVMAYLPSWLLHFSLRIPSAGLKRFRGFMTTAREVAQEIVDTQTTLYQSGKEGAKDIFSILVRANLSEDPKATLRANEVLSQMTTIFAAGHDSTKFSLSWFIYQLSKHPKYQRFIREEIKATHGKAAERGDSELTIGDLDSMKYMLAALKETLRFNCVIDGLMRQAEKDDIIPLSIPQKTKTGTTVTSIPISKGQIIMLSHFAYNRLPEVWGPDADQWRPERFLEGIEASQKVQLGVFANLLSFSSGLRGCIGWRFAVLEMQTILIELLENFEFAPSPANEEIILASAGMMTPMVKDSKERKANLPLKLTML
ncbi:hypothetical protein M422DRAFT_247541 [Sphaerobolus stellatus SS14]|nr:hypothetical protein M422DRAFT_247541 [Sphaerobolus stellatus SS14]